MYTEEDWLEEWTIVFPLVLLFMTVVTRVIHRRLLKLQGQAKKKQRLLLVEKQKERDRLCDVLFDLREEQIDLEKEVGKHKAELTRLLMEQERELAEGVRQGSDVNGGVCHSNNAIPSGVLLNHVSSAVSDPGQNFRKPVGYCNLTQGSPKRSLSNLRTYSKRLQDNETQCHTGACTLLSAYECGYYSRLDAVFP